MTKEHKIEGEQAYPIYYIAVKWTQDIMPDYDTSDWQTKELPKGRMFNSTSFHRMYKEEQDIEALKYEIEHEWLPKHFDAKSVEKYSLPHLPIINPQPHEISVKFLRYETWCLEWFCHWTFDDGRSDEEYLASFERFVRRMEQLPEGEYCLMGAEDRWRWRGTTDDGRGETKPPCRCAGCKEAGVVRINH